MHYTAKIHGSYKAISGGQIAEAFLDLTGSPTLEYYFDRPNFDPKRFWTKLVDYRRQQLPMGCGTTTTQEGIVGMHAYSILDVREVTNVSIDFFREKLVQGTLGGVSGFTEYDGIVRLLRIRNPHGKGEWKGDFSDNSSTWERLLSHQTDQSRRSDESPLTRTMENDGTFWIDYDSFLMGFSNVDVVLAFQGNHAKSFSSNFPAKKSPHRCTRAFEVSMIENQPGLQTMDTVDVYVMPVQKTRRGASRGRADRKVSYKICDMGVLVARGDPDTNGSIDYDHVIHGKMLGFTRVGHHKIVLNRHGMKAAIIMPISFGHPAATDKLMSFAIRFVSNKPVMIRELSSVPRMDRVFESFCLNSALITPLNNHLQARKYILFDRAPMYRVYVIDCTGKGSSDHSQSAGGTAFFYLHINDKKSVDTKFSFSIQVKCRGMVCRTEHGLSEHERIGHALPKQRFRAAWRKYRHNFVNETRSRLLMVLTQSGQDCEFRSTDVVFSLVPLDAQIPVDKMKKSRSNRSTKISFAKEERNGERQPTTFLTNNENFNRGIFGSVKNNMKYISGDEFFPVNPIIDFSGVVARFDEENDAELQKAIELSRNEAEFSEVIENSKQEDGRESLGYMDNEYFDLQRAINLSKNDVSSKSESNQTDSDLTKAIKMSLQNQKDDPPMTTIKKQEVINIEETTQVDQRVSDDIIEILDDD